MSRPPSLTTPQPPHAQALSNAINWGESSRQAGSSSSAYQPVIPLAARTVPRRQTDNEEHISIFNF